MNSDFIPFKLNSDLKDLRHNLEYICSDNGIDVYKESQDLTRDVFGFPVNVVNLYFFEGSLITVYMHLTDNPEVYFQLYKILETSMKPHGMPLKLDCGSGYKWKCKTSTLTLIRDMKKGELFMYYSLKKFDVFLRSDDNSNLNTK